MNAPTLEAGAQPASSDMAALVYESPRVMTLRKLAVPAIGPGEALVAVAFSGICGSELSGFVGQSSIRQPPLVFGHEVSGHVVAFHGDAATNSALEIGSPVAVNPLISCGRCRYCVTGRQQLCPRRLLLGASMPGGNAEFVRVPVSSLLPIPAGLSLQRAATCEPAAFAIHAVEVSGVQPASTALVVGAGAIGLFILQVLAEFGVRQRFVVERDPTRLAMAVALGCVPLDPADGELAGLVRRATDGSGVDVAFDAVGSPETRRGCLSSVADGGTVVLVGLHTDNTELSLNTVIRSEITLKGVFAYSSSNFRTAMQWLHEDRVGLRTGVVVAPLFDGQHWFERLVTGDPAAKVLLDPRSTSAGDQ